jgi:glycosyltransferase involved in cell wall biosynthesis
MSNLLFSQYETKPTVWISILIATYNTENQYITDCLNSILFQNGNFGIELVIINDGSDNNNTIFLERFIKSIEKTNNLKIIYARFDKNNGLSYCLHKGVLLCSNELIFRMDSDDIMDEFRIITQLNFMNENPDCVICGTNITPFTENNGEKQYYNNSNHPEYLSYEKYKETKHFWLLNHPTLCFKKSAVLSIGNYDINCKLPFEDLILEVKLLKKYGFICNISKSLLLYRIHNNQVTHKTREKSQQNNIIKKQIIENIISNNDYASILAQSNGQTSFVSLGILLPNHKEG